MPMHSRFFILNDPASQRFASIWASSSWAASVVFKSHSLQSWYLESSRASSISVPCTPNRTLAAIKNKSDFLAPIHNWDTLQFSLALGPQNTFHLDWSLSSQEIHSIHDLRLTGTGLFFPNRDDIQLPIVQCFPFSPIITAQNFPISADIQGCALIIYVTISIFLGWFCSLLLSDLVLKPENSAKRLTILVTILYRQYFLSSADRLILLHLFPPTALTLRGATSSLISDPTILSSFNPFDISVSSSIIGRCCQTRAITVNMW